MNIGIDIGLTCTSIVAMNDKKKIVATINFGVNFGLAKWTDAHPARRYTQYVYCLVDFFKQNNITGTIVLEDPMGSFLGNSIKLAELKGAYLVALTPIVQAEKIFLPKAGTIKKFFTGDGAADKTDMINECARRGYNPMNDHQADAIAMALMGIELYSSSKVKKYGIF